MSRYPVLVIYWLLLGGKRIGFRDGAAQTTSTKQAGGMNWCVWDEPSSEGLFNRAFLPTKVSLGPWVAWTEAFRNGAGLWCLVGLEVAGTNQPPSALSN